MSVQIQKIKIGKKDIPTLQYERILNSGITEQCSLEGSNPVSSAFRDQLDQLLAIVISSLALDEVWSDRGFVSGVSIKYSDEGFGLNITAQMRVDEDPEHVYQAVVNSPYMPPHSLNSEDARIVRRLVEMANAYINSEPRQLRIA